MQRLDRRFLTVSLVVGIMLFCVQSALGQIEHLAQRDGQEMIQLDIPARIVMSPEGEPELFVARWGPIPEQIWRNYSLPQTALVYSKDLAGNMWIGGFPQVAGDTETRTLRWNEPIALIEQDDGSFVMESRERVFSPLGAGPFPAHYMAPESVLDSVPILYTHSKGGTRLLVPKELEPVSLEETASPSVVSKNVPIWAELDLENDSSQIVVGITTDDTRTRPEKADAFTKDHDGHWIWGGYTSNKSDDEQKINEFTGKHGTRIREIENGKFNLIVASGPSYMSHSDSLPKYPTETRRFLSHRIHLLIHYLDHKSGEHDVQRGLFGTPSFLPTFNNWPSQIEEDSFARGALRWRAMIDQNIIIVFDVEWDVNNSTFPAGNTDFGFAELDIIDNFDYRSYVSVQQALEFNAAFLFNEDLQEQTLYASMPLGTVEAEFPNSTSAISTIATPRALSLAMLLPVLFPGDSVGTIWINPQQSSVYDYDPSTNGVSPGKRDFEGIAAHEMCHMLGFAGISGLPTLYPLEDRITVFDIFRIKNSDLSNGAISGGLFSQPIIQEQIQAIRYLVAHDNFPFPEFSSLVTRLSIPDWVTPLGRFLNADGTSNESSVHWLPENAAPPQRGLMEPFSLPGQPRPIRTADIRAMDIIGWNIQFTEWVPGGAAANSNPQQSAIDVDLEPIFQWTTDAFVSTVHLLIWQDGTQILNVPGLTDDFYITPPGVLDFETTYDWAILTVNSKGVDQSETWSFTTEAEIIEPPACPADLNGDGVVDTADLGGLLGSFGNTGPPGTVFGDINEDGVVDTADLGILLGSFGPCPV